MRTDSAEENFLSAVQLHSGLSSREEARNLARGTLSALDSAVSSGQTEQITRHLPPAFRPVTAESGQAVAWDKGAFLDAVSGSVRTTDLEETEVLVAAVLNAVREQAPDGETDDTLDQLPPDLAALFHGAPGRR